MDRLNPVLVLVVAFLLVPVAAAADVTVTATDSSVKPGTGDAATFDVAVTNTGDETREYTLSYNGAGSGGWYFLDTYTMTLRPGETGNSTLYAEPDEAAVAGNYGVILTVSSDDGETVERRPSYRIVRDRDILITDITTTETTAIPGSVFNATADIKNVRSTELPRNAYEVVFTFAGETRTVSVPSLIASEPERITASFTAPRHESGVMSVDVEVRELGGAVQDTASAQVKIAKTENIVTDRDSDFMLVASRTTIAVNNTGNTASNGTTVTAQLPPFTGLFTSFDPAPASTAGADGGTLYTWDLGSVPPGTARTISYRINWWAPGLFALLLIGAVGLGIRQYRSPRVVKRTVRRDGTTAVHLRVVNRSGSLLRNVTVRDTVPGIASLIEKFDASPPETIRTSGDETRMEWNLGRLEPGEERILTYEISPQVEVEGSVSLPSATLQYEAGERETQRTSSPAGADFS